MNLLMNFNFIAIYLMSEKNYFIKAGVLKVMVKTNFIFNFDFTLNLVIIIKFSFVCLNLIINFIKMAMLIT